MNRETLLGGLLVLGAAYAGLGGDLEAVQKAGVLRHLGVPYANFVTGTRLSGENDGFDVELMQAFAQSLGVRYEFKAATWERLIPMLTGDEVRLEGARATVVGKTRVEGDVAASGITVLAWRQGLVAFSEPEFPTQVWLISHSDSDLKPIQPAGIETDILEVKKMLQGRSLYCKEKTCLDPSR